MQRKHFVPVPHSWFLRNRIHTLTSREQNSSKFDDRHRQHVPQLRPSWQRQSCASSCGWLGSTPLLPKGVAEIDPVSLRYKREYRPKSEAWRPHRKRMEALPSLTPRLRLLLPTHSSTSGNVSDTSHVWRKAKENEKCPFSREFDPSVEESHTPLKM